MPESVGKILFGGPKSPEAANYGRQKKAMETVKATYQGAQLKGGKHRRSHRRKTHRRRR